MDKKCNVTELPLYSQVYCICKHITLNAESYIELGPFPIEKKDVPLYFAGLDALIIILYVVMLISLRSAENDYVQKV
jgi:hypothetical protein